MKIMIPITEDKGFKSNAVSRFGRAPYFAVVDEETKQIEFIENKAIRAGGGAGVESAQLVADKEVDILIVHNIGPKAFRGVKKAGVKVYSLESLADNIEDILEKYNNGELKELTLATNTGHHGM